MYYKLCPSFLKVSESLNRAMFKCRSITVDVRHTAVYTTSDHLGECEAREKKFEWSRGGSIRAALKWRKGKRDQARITSVNDTTASRDRK